MKKFKKLLATLGTSVLFGLAIALLLQFEDRYISLIERIENLSYDLRYWLKTEPRAGDDARPDYGINIIDIDELSMEKMGSYWNWDRGYQAKMLDALSPHFPASIAYDVTFYTYEDKNHQARFSRAISEATRGDTTLQEYANEFGERVVSMINYDKQFEEAILRSGRVTLGFAFMSERDYGGKTSAVEERMTMEWHNSLSPASALVFPDSLLEHIRHRKTILDGIYTENARAARDIGHINMVSLDNDEVIRHGPLLYRFGETDAIYLPMSVRIAATLFGTPNEEIEFRPNRYIDIGKPFKIFKEKDGRVRFSYPDFTEAQLRMILKKRDEILALKNGDKRIGISKYVALYRDDDDDVCIEMSGGRLPRELTVALFGTELSLTDMEVGSEAELGGGYTALRETSTEWELFSDDGHSFWMTGDDINTLAALTIDDIVMDDTEKRKLLLFDFSVKRENGILVTSIPAIRAEVMDELLADGSDPIEAIAPGARRDFGRSVRIPLRNGNSHIITYFGRGKSTFDYFSFYDVMMDDGFIKPMQGQIFIVGSASPVLFDIKPVPHENNYPAVEIHASVLNSILTNTFVRRLESWMDFLILVALGATMAFIALKTKTLFASLFAIAAILLYGYAAIHIFEKELIWIEMVSPILTIILTFSSIMAYRYMTEEKDRKFLQSTFKQYLSPELIDMMYTEKQKPQLGGDEGILTAYFTDIEGFSTFSEKLGSPTRLVELLNEYLTAMTDILLSHYGTLDKYEGDAIIAFFGAPVHNPDHATQACRTALDMQIKLTELRDKWAKEKCDRRCADRAKRCGDKCGEKDKWPEIVHRMRMRIGINTGKIVTGNMGSATRMNYTMMGDAVNLAARLESAAKQYGVYTMISNFTYDMIKDEFDARVVDKITVVGKSEPVTVYELLGEKGKLQTEMQKLVEAYDKGVECYYAKDFENAKTHFEKSAQFELNKTGKTNPSKHFIEMCDVYIANPPGDDWDGVERLTSK